ncbi:MAG: DUF1707 domain-containing protein [Gordonia sp. (in: high G+C Gram-positive bacteria)]|jgi:hypothetical protein|nr:MAG: DUF1707 domain-containing protein [Gordonia sp. (in: high G+C Gram-positive bacteria)]
MWAIAGFVVMMCESRVVCAYAGIMTGLPASLRAADCDRERVARQLQSEVGTGRLSLDEYSERVGRAFAARTLGELAVLTDDLPVPDAAGSSAAHRSRWRPPIVAAAAAALVLIGGGIAAATELPAHVPASMSMISGCR